MSEQLAIQTPNRVAEVRGPVRSNQQTSPEVFEHAVAELPEPQKETLQWWFYHGRENDLSLTSLGRKAGVSATSLSRAFRGAYAADLANLCETLTAARENLTQMVRNPDFIMTSLAKEMWEIFDTARDLETIELLYGPKGIGKTVVAKEYKRLNNHGKTHYHRCSPGMTFGQFVTSLAASMGIPSHRHSHLRLRGKIIAVLAAGKRLLILDELHQLFLRKPRSEAESALLICEFIREIYDLAGCGVAMIGTRALAVDFEKHEAALEQLLDRALDPIDLPAKPTRGDADALISHFGLSVAESTPEAAAIIKDIFVISGLRKLTVHLRAGARHAAKLGQTYRWHHFVAAHDRRASLTKKAR